MIRVTVELIPYGILKPKHLGTALMINDGTGDASTGNYKVIFKRADKRFYKECEVKNFPRKRRLAWDLLYRALREIVGERNK